MRSTYTFKKGYSRSSNSSNSDSETPPPKLKRAKRDSEERKKEVDNLTSLIENVKSHLQIKQKRLEKAKSVKDFKQCDQLTLEIRTLLKEKSDHERQLTAIQKKAKSLWYHKTKSSKKEKKPKTEKAVNKPLTKFLFKDTSAAKVVASSNETTSTAKIPLESATSASSQATIPTTQVTSDTCTSSETTAELSTVTNAPLSPTDTLILSDSVEDSDF